MKMNRMHSKLKFTDDENEDKNIASESISKTKHTVDSISNPISRWHHKQRFKKKHITGKKTKKNIVEFIAKHKNGAITAGIIAVMALLLLNTMSSCSVLFQSGLTAIGATTYPSKSNDILSAEEKYCAMEDELQAYIDNYERTHTYNECHYDLDEIGHDPYVLVSAITALHGGEWTVDEVGDILELLFDKQYTLTESVRTETRYRTEKRIGYREYIDPITGEVTLTPYEYTVRIPYTYYICTVTLENFDLSHVPAYVMTEEQLSMYASYMSTLGNRPDLFSDSVYIDLYYKTEYEDYEIPAEALEDEQFAAMITEAEKYLGYPYVWGGSSPSTSFDCSGFVSWVLNHSGWNIGRLSANGLRNICTKVSASNAKPGDLIFFQGTYDTVGASHVGIYVGNNKMLHCGDPISYADINTSYWQEHFLSFGRLPRT